METTMFTLGVLSIILAALVAITIYGIVKVFKLKTEIQNIWQQMNLDRQDMFGESESINRNIHILDETISRQISEERRELDRLIGATIDDINMVEATMQNVIKQLETDSMHAAKSYTDSRIDKLIDTYFEVQSIKKQILKD